MEQTTQPEDMYNKGFNHGYMLAEHEPELHSELIKSKNEDNDYFQGLTDGGLQYQSEKMEQKLTALQENKKNKKRSR